MYTSEAESLLRYYNAELQYLRRMGAAFAERYPRVAARLEMSAENCADPTVERMIESFALLTARVQKRIDAEFPQVSASLLGVLYPHLVNPAPPMSIARFEPDPTQGKLTGGYPIAAGTALFAQTAEDLTCRFRTCYPVMLWPVQISEAAVEPAAQYEFLDRYPGVAAVLRLRISAVDVPLHELDLDSLRIHLAGEPVVVSTLYELVFAHTRGILVRPEGAKTPTRLTATAPDPVGFGRDEAVLPAPAHALPAYRLLQEYFLFPEKYHFLDIRPLRGHLSGASTDIFLLLDRLPGQRFYVDERNFLTGCTPIVNLFRRTTEPIRLDHRRHEYLLDPDVRRERTTEIHSVTAVSASSSEGDLAVRLEPFYSWRHRMDGRSHTAFWYARRAATRRVDTGGTDLYISFVDLDLNPALPPHQTVYAHTLCTNRELAVQLAAGALLQTEDKAPVTRISCLNRPTAPVYPPMEGTTVWHLISNLSLNFLSLSDDSVSVDALREILRLYSFNDTPSVYQQVQGVRSVSCRPISARTGREPWRGFCRGTEVSVTLDESMFVGNTGFLFGAVLNHFLSLYTALNSFTQLVMYSEQREGVWKRWAPLAGSQALL